MSLQPSVVYNYIEKRIRVFLSFKNGKGKKIVLIIRFLVSCYLCADHDPRKIIHDHPPFFHASDKENNSSKIKSTKQIDVYVLPPVTEAIIYTLASTLGSVKFKSKSGVFLKPSTRVRLI